MEPNSSRFRSHTPASDFSSGSSSSNGDLMGITGV